MAVSEIKTTLQSARKYPLQNPEPYRNQPISFLCKSIDCFPHNTILCQKHLQADLNQKFQGIKKKKKIRKPTHIILKPYRNQPISFLCKSIDCFPHNTILCQKHLQADLNQKFQGIKKKYIEIYIYIYIYIHIYIHTHIHIYAYTYTHIYIYTYIFIYIYIYTYIHTQIHIYTCIYTHTYTYTHYFKTIQKPANQLPLQIN